MVRRNSAFSLLALMFALLAGIPAGVGQSESPITTINDAVGLNGASDGDGSWYVTERVSVSSSETEANGLGRGSVNK